MTRLIALILLLGTPALSDATIGGKTVECYCTDRSGARIEMGETICLQVDGKMFMAQCQMSLNVPMWRKISDGCLSSSLSLSPSSRLPQSLEPAVDAGGVDAQI